MHKIQIGVSSCLLGEEVRYDGELDLAKAAIKVMKVRSGLELSVHSDVLPGSGLGSSSAMTVALIGVIKHWKKIDLDDYKIAELAYDIERKETGIQGGRQDQYIATFGGFNFIEFFKDSRVVTVFCKFVTSSKPGWATANDDKFSPRI